MMLDVLINISPTSGNQKYGKNQHPNKYSTKKTCIFVWSGFSFMQSKQLELGDSMDLSSYLLKPVQRISKYSLLLQEMLEECGSEHVSERKEIHGAAEVVRFQLRHGNDLLTMDAIQDCDVSKKSGRLRGNDS